MSYYLIESPIESPGLDGAVPFFFRGVSICARIAANLHALGYAMERIALINAMLAVGCAASTRKSAVRTTIGQSEGVPREDAHADGQVRPVTAEGKREARHSEQYVLPGCP